MQNNENNESTIDTKTIQTAGRAFEDFFSAVIRLRSPGGCPWDLEQTPASMRSDLIEECFEAIDAINEGESDHVKEELGDVLLNTVLISFMYEQNGDFSVADVIDEVREKIVRRHPHVFTEKQSEEVAEVVQDVRKNGNTAKTSDEVLAQWDAIKRGVEGRKQKSILDEVSGGLPPLLRAYKLQKKAAKKGFDWEHARDVEPIVLGEFEELRAAKTRDEREEEAGDVLFSVVNYVRHLGVDPTVALARANEKFYKRFLHVEKRMDEHKGETLDLKTLDRFWNEAKIQDKN